ncbi:MAG: c-type cytochrome [Gemmatimonadota bacterium]
MTRRTLIAVVVLVAACGPRPVRPEQRIDNSDPGRGKRAIAEFGCGSCHEIPGVRGAVGLVGPPLTHWSKRRFIAGEMENTPEHLITWITMPQAVEPGTAMPNMGISDGAARDIASYLYTIR